MRHRASRVSSITTLRRSLKLLSKNEQKRIFLVILLQIAFSILDLIAVAIVGILGSLAITGVGSRKPGNRVEMVLNFLGLQNQTLQTQAAILGIAAASLMILKTIFTVIFARKTVFFLSRRSAIISSRLVARVLSQSLVQMQQKSMQQSLFSVTNGVDIITMGILNTSIIMISDIALLIILSAGLFFVDPTIAFSTFFVFGAVGFILYKLMEVRAREIGQEQTKLAIKSNERILEVLNSFREILVRGRRGYYVDEIERIRLSLANLTAERAFMPNISKYVIEITLVIGSLCIGAVQFATNDAPRAVAVLSVFLAASTRISPAVLRLQQGAIAIRASIGSSGPTLDLIEQLERYSPIEKIVEGSEIKISHDGFKSTVRLKEVSFSYPGSKKMAIEHASLEISEGEIIAIVGPSGAGKTTLVDILLGVISPDSGSVRISNLEPQSAVVQWPGAISYVPQDVVITNGTIRENVAMGYPQALATDDLVYRALDTAQLKNLVQGLDLGLENYVGDRGAKLSGGQRQRLGIARALLTNPKLLVLDEATSALDGETENQISSAINKLKGSVTVILIAHRLSTVRSADRVIYMQNGKILAEGSFEEVRENVPNFDEQARLMGL
ncbi:MdlB ABC-type multidrug transport system, ATPase and permease components [Candidatus Nanopelagicaceae bacterium]